MSSMNITRNQHRFAQNLGSFQFSPISKLLMVIAIIFQVYYHSPKNVEDINQGMKPLCIFLPGAVEFPVFLALQLKYKGLNVVPVGGKTLRARGREITENKRFLHEPITHNVIS